jgi:TonB family protein
LIHAAAIALVLFLSASKHSPINQLLTARDTVVYTPRQFRNSPGGGGGQHSPLPVTKGQPPKPAPRVFTMPVMTVRDTMPELPMAPAILAPPDPNMPAVDLAHIGLPTGVSGVMSGGPGSGGLGSTNGPGAGNRGGSGLDGAGGDGITPLPHGRNVTRPQLISKKEPEYSDEARKAKIQGTVQLSVVVTASGQVGDIRVIRSLGLGLDERAMDAVRQWKFRAATVDGKPVSTRAVVEVTFRLL